MSTTDTLVGKRIGKYQIVEQLGQGGMARVYKAYHPSLDRHVAIKLMHSFLVEDEGFVGRFQREAKAIAALRHPNIVQVHDFDVQDDLYFMVMEFIDGQSLKAVLDALATSGSATPVEEAIRIAKDVASALSYAHARDMIHRDVKPANVMITGEGQVILTDFGIVKILGSAQYTVSGAMTGTPAYMSPEQGLGQAGDARTDIYSLGVMFFQMLAGEPPYSADEAMPLAVVLKHIQDPIPDPLAVNPELPPGATQIISRAMAKEPDDRFQSAAEFAEHLERLRSGAEIPETEVAGAPAGAVGIDTGATPVAMETTVELMHYTLSAGQTAIQPTSLPDVCDANWDAAAAQFAKGYMTNWLRDSANRLRAAHQHGLADNLDAIAEEGEALLQGIRGGDAAALNAGLEQFLELLGAPPPVIEIQPEEIVLSAVGVGQAGRPVDLIIANAGRGYLSGRIACRVPWLRVTPVVFGCMPAGSCMVSIKPALANLPPGKLLSEGALGISSNDEDRSVDVRVEILPADLQIDATLLDMGPVGHREEGEAVFNTRNSGRGYLTGTIHCREPWLRALPRQFMLRAGESVDVTVIADSQMLAPGATSKDLAVVIKSNGGHAVLGVRIEVLAQHLEVKPTEVDLGVIDLGLSAAAIKAGLTVSNRGAGVMVGQIMADADWLAAQPRDFRCSAGEQQQVVLSTTKLRVGDHRHVVRLVSTSEEAAVPVLLQVRLSQEPEMLQVPAGEFLRGSKARDRWALAVEKPQRRIHLSEYWIARCPVTNAQYAAFMRHTGHRAPAHWGGREGPKGFENHPVVNVSWFDAGSYCRWLADVTGKPYRVPTEAEWEKAARGNSGRIYPWGRRWSKRRANTTESGAGTTTPVGAASPGADSPFGCADMAGNVWEWVADWYDPEYYERSTRLQDPYGPDSGATRVLRGGSWRSNSRKARSASRFFGNPVFLSPEVGFRCVRA